MKLKDKLLVIFATFILISIVCGSVGYFISEIGAGQVIDRLITKHNEEIHELFTEAQTLMNFINPKGYNDTVTIFEDDTYYYIVHTQNFTYGNLTGNSFRILKGEGGSLPTKNIEVWDYENTNGSSTPR